MEPREVEGLGSWPFDPDCYVLLQTLDFVVRQLPGGFALRPFGSFVSGTAVKPAVLDLAIYEERPSVRPAPLRIDPVDSLCDLLLRRFPERFQLLEQRQGPGQRILATNFGRPSSRQELLLFQGDLLSGEIVLTLQYLLPLHPEAVAMVKTLKRWAFRCRLHQPGEGCFGWTLLVVFFLQQQGFLPPLEEFKRGEMPRLQPDPRELRELIFEFADFAISIWSRPHPRPSINIWKGRLDPVEASLPYTHPGDRAVVEELRRLRQEVGDPSRRLHRLGESGQLARQNFMRQFPDHDITGRTSSTPPPVARGRGALQPGARRDRAEIKPPTATSSMSRASSVSPLTAASAGRPPPPRSRWHIDESWVAYKTCQGRVVETVQLNPEEQGQLTREGWAQRFERREWQVHLGKITSEYERWASHWLRHGRSEGDPVTPRAVTQSSKAAFEAQYLNWRVKLHSNPPA